MKLLKTRSVMVAFFVIGSMIAIAVPVAAETSETETGFNLFEDPATLQRAFDIYELEQASLAGDIEARNILDSIGYEIKEVFPNGSILSGPWSNATQIALEDWQSRKGEDEPAWTYDNSDRLQAAASAGLVPYRTPTPAFSRNILITRDEGAPIQDEPYLCVNPEDPNNIIVVSHNYGYRYSPAHTSFDGGETWSTARLVPTTNDSVFSGDPVVACGRNDKAYYNFMSIGSNDYILLGQPISIIKSDIAVSTSQDGGLTWNQPSTVASNKLAFEQYPVENPATGEIVNLPVVVFSFLDKNWVSLGPNPDNPEKDILYASYTQFTVYYYVTQPIRGFYMLQLLQYTSEIKVHSSENEGRTWEDTNLMEPVSVFDDVVGTMNTAVGELSWRVVQGSQLATGPDGTVYAAWYDSTTDGSSRGNAQYWVASSADHGETWSEPVLAADVLETNRNPRSAPFRTPALPAMAAGPDGNVYLVFSAKTSDKPEDDGDIYFVAGKLNRQGVLRFGRAVMLNQDNTNNLQFFPAIDVAPDGSVHVMWGDTRDDDSGLRYHIYYTKSEDKGQTWGFEFNDIYEPEMRVSDFASNPNKAFPGGRFIGDYWGIKATGDDIYMVWTDARLGEYGPFNSKIAFARRSAVGSPEVYLNPARGPAGQAITVQAHGFQPDMSVFVRIGTEIANCGITDDTGFVSCSSVIPFIAPDQSQQIIVFDESGNVAVTSFYVEADVNTSTVPSGSGNYNTSEDDNDSSRNVMTYVLILLVGTVVFFGAKKKYKQIKNKEKN